MPWPLMPVLCRPYAPRYESIVVVLEIQAELMYFEQRPDKFKAVPRHVVQMDLTGLLQMDLTGLLPGQLYLRTCPPETLRSMLSCDAWPVEPGYVELQLSRVWKHWVRTGVPNARAADAVACAQRAAQELGFSFDARCNLLNCELLNYRLRLRSDEPSISIDQRLEQMYNEQEQLENEEKQQSKLIRMALNLRHEGE